MNGVDPKDFLDKIVASKREKVAQRKIFLENIKRNVESSRLTRYSLFKESIVQPGKISLIAEIKRASPSKGVLCQEFGVSHLARLYKETGAAALSVLTEEKFFLGRPDYVRLAADFDLPVLAKDFFIDELQVYEAFSFNASAILLIMAILTDEEVKRFQEAAQRLDMDCMIEVHTQEELDRALRLDADIIGVNNRDLSTFKVDLKVGERLLAQIPDGKVRVIESGLRNHEDVVHFKNLGAHAALIGETFVRSADIPATMREVMGDELPQPKGRG